MIGGSKHQVHNFTFVKNSPNNRLKHALLDVLGTSLRAKRLTLQGCDFGSFRSKGVAHKTTKGSVGPGGRKTAEIPKRQTSRFFQVPYSNFGGVCLRIKGDQFLRSFFEGGQTSPQKTTQVVGGIITASGKRRTKDSSSHEALSVFFHANSRCTAIFVVINILVVLYFSPLLL